MTARDRSQSSSIRARHESCSKINYSTKRLASLVALMVALQSPTMASTSPHRRNNEVLFGSMSDASTSISWHDYSSDNQDDRNPKKHYNIYVSEEEDENNIDEYEERVLSAMARVDQTDDEIQYTEDMTGNDYEWTQSSPGVTTDASNAKPSRKEEGDDRSKAKQKQTANFLVNKKAAGKKDDLVQKQKEEEDAEGEDTFLRKLHRFKETLRQTRTLNDAMGTTVREDSAPSTKKSISASPQAKKTPRLHEVTRKGRGQTSRTVGQPTTTTHESAAAETRIISTQSATPSLTTESYFATSSIVPDERSFQLGTSISEQRSPETGLLNGEADPLSKTQERLPNNRHKPISKPFRPHSSYNKQPIGQGSPVSINSGTRQRTNAVPATTATQLQTSPHGNLDSTSRKGRASLTGSRASPGAAMTSTATSSSNNSHDDVSPWVRKFLSTRPKDCLVLVPRDYLMDNFNLARLAPVIEHLATLKQTELETPSPNLEHHSRTNTPRSSVSPNGGRIQAQQNQMPQNHVQQQETPQKNPYPIYKQALALILRQKDDPNEEEEPTQVVQFAAEVLYCLVHARFVVSPRGLDTIRSRMVIHESHRINQPLFGRCPRLACGGMPLLPCGLSDDYIPDESQMTQSRAKRYCCNCREIFHCWDSKVQGCAWAGKSLCHLLLLVYGKNELFPSHFASEGSLAVSISGHSLASSGTRPPEPPEQHDFGRIFGFPIHPQVADSW